jgi:two-component system, cell cycle sensor histidine kinase PleC
VTHRHDPFATDRAGHSEPARSEQLLVGQNRVLRLLAEGRPLADVLDELCRGLEAVMPGAACSVVLLDETGQRLRPTAAPSLPPGYSQGFDGLQIGPTTGSCGTAAFLAQPVIVADIETDPLWMDFRDLARTYQLRACWSVPIFDRESGRVLGTFAVYYREPRAPTADEFALVDQSGDLAGVAIVHSRNQAGLVAAKEAAEAAKEAAEAANRAKSHFLAMISHELRTPLQAVLGYAEFLLADPRGTLAADQREDIGYIHRGGQRMLTIIAQMLDLSRIEAGRLEVADRIVDLAEVVEQVRQDVTPQASQKGVILRIARPSTLPPVRGDAERLRQILLNLAGNAVKFTDDGFIEFTAARNGESVAVTVRDTGCGIAPEALPHIFETFRQVDSQLSRRHGGAGLGLAIAQRLAMLMGGGISVESTLGVGSIFTLTVPAASPPRP